MKNSITLVLVFLCFLSLNAQRNKKIKGNGNFVTITINTQEYSGISVGGPFEVALVAGDEGTITIKGEDNILDHIETKVINGTLTIKKRKNLNLRPSRNERVLITIPVESINAIRLSGSGKLYSSKILKSDHFNIRTSGSRFVDLRIEARSITVQSSGSSNMKLQGNAKTLNLTSSGSSKINGYDLEVDTIDFRGSGSSNVKITVHKSINARVSGSCYLKYKGNPEKIHSKTSGSANVSNVK